MSILYSKIRKHIIGEIFFWSLGALAFLLLIWSYFVYLIRGNVFFPFSLGNFLILFLSYLLIMSISYSFINLYRLKKFHEFCENFLTESDAQFCKIMIEKKDYKMLAPYTAHEAAVRPYPVPTNAVHFETNELLLLFFSVRHYFVIKEVLKPYVFVRPDKDLCIKDKSVNVVRDFEITETEQGKAIIFSNKQGIKRVIIPLVRTSTSVPIDKVKKNE